jgi:hypothetical protein
MHDMGELDVLFVDNHTCLFTGFPDKRSCHRLARFEMTGRQLPGTVFVAGFLALPEKYFARRIDEQQVDVAAAADGKPATELASSEDVAAAGVRYGTAGDLRSAGLAVIHTSGRKGESNGHVSVVWPDANPLDEQDPAWPTQVQEAFAACFTEAEE